MKLTKKLFIEWLFKDGYFNFLPYLEENVARCLSRELIAFTEALMISWEYEFEWFYFKKLNTPISEEGTYVRTEEDKCVVEDHYEYIELKKNYEALLEKSKGGEIDEELSWDEFIKDHPLYKELMNRNEELVFDIKEMKKELEEIQKVKDTITAPYIEKLKMTIVRHEKKSWVVADEKEVKEMVDNKNYEEMKAKKKLEKESE